MPGISSSDAKKQMEQPNNDLSEAMRQLSVSSDETSAQPKNLSDMPVDVVALIIERSDYLEQLKLRKVCKSLCALVDKQKPACTCLKMHCYKDEIICYYNDERVVYVPPIAWNSFRHEGEDRLIQSDDYKKIAFNDLASTLKNPKLQLEILTVHCHEPSNHFEYRFGFSIPYLDLRAILESIGHQPSVRSCEINVVFPSQYCMIFPYLKPGVLEKITVWDNSNLDTWDEDASLDTMKQALLSDQWKQAQELSSVFSSKRFPMKYAKHFKRFRFKEISINGSLLIRMRNYLSSLNNFEYCLIEDVFSIDAQHLHSEVGRPAAPNERTKYVSHYSIPDSDDYLEFMFFEKSIEIRKIKRS